jgi:hypothetical protein
MLRCLLLRWSAAGLSLLISGGIPCCSGGPNPSSRNLCRLQRLQVRSQQGLQPALAAYAPSKWGAHKFRCHA